MLCDKGVLPMPFQPTYNTHVKMSGMTVATALDKQPIVNIPCFGACSMTGGQPCVPAPLLWLDTYKVKVKGQQTLLYKSKLPCSLGGQIEFLTSGQIPLPAEEYDSLLEEHGEETGGGWGWWDTAELIPVIGNVIGIVREAKKGNWGMFALNAAFLVVDVVTFGAGAAVTTPLKGGIKAAVKVGAKKGLQKATQTATKLGTKAGTKQLAKGAAKSFGKAVAKKVDDIAKATGKVCVFACFPKGTKVAVKGGNKAIEEIQEGDKVWAYDEESGSTELKRVVSTMQREVDATVKIVLAEEEIETTAEHPFYTQAGWKDAADLSSNDRLRTREGKWQRIKSVEFAYEQKKVYNFEVADWHTYFVGAWQWLVHNATVCIVSAVKKVSKRLLYLGRTPGKGSKTGKAVFDRMLNEIPPAARIRKGVKQFYDPDNQVWRNIKYADMGHKEDAVTWWNDFARHRFKAKSKEIRKWMLDPDNYVLEYYKTNRSKGAIVGQTIGYKPPLK